MKIKNWYLYGNFIAGNVYGNPRFKDGTFVYTSKVLKIEDNVAHTYSGSVYELVDPINLEKKNEA